MAENTLEFECLYDKKEVKVEQYDHVEGYEVSDKFNPNKQGILLKELIYSPDIVHASFSIKIQESRITAQQEQTLPIVNTTRLSSSKEKNKLIPFQPTDIKPILTPILDKIRLRLVLYKVKSLSTITPNFDIPKEFICQWEFFNETLIHHITLEGVPWVEKPIEIKKGQKNENTLNVNNSARNNNHNNNNLNSSNHPIPYLLVCYIDQTEAPDYMKDISGNLLRMRNVDIFWSIRVFSSDTLGFVKDTTKEDSEKILKVSWETNEQGRCEKSMKSRIRFLLQAKKDKGAQLTPEEEFIISEVRARKISTAPLLEEHKASISINLHNLSNKKGNTTNKKSENIKANDRKGNSASLAPIMPAVIAYQEPKKIENVKVSQLPLPDKHVSDYIKNFLFYSYDERTHIFDNNLNQMQKLIVDNKTKEDKTNQIMKSNEDYEKSRAKGMNLFAVNKSENFEVIKSFYKTSFSFRKETIQDTNTLIKARDNLKNEFQNKFEMEKNIREIIANSAMQIDYAQAIALFKEYPTFTNYDTELVIHLHQIISMKKEENLRTELKKLTVKDKVTILKHLDDIKSNKLIISADIQQKLREIIK